ncbi:hypothetical protein EDE12_1121 [Methylosinus sp. sav-2]|nr:hypothetical protein EDE12_1121 [Methylosinus sp. sav-2]
MPADRQGGSWMTGYDKWNDEYFIFCNVGVAGRSGHNYANRWEGKELVWFGKGPSRADQPVIRELTSAAVPVHIFWRGKNSTPFTYAGQARPVVIYAETPVLIVWAFDADRMLAHALKEPPAPPPVFRRGPPPVPGARSFETHEGETTLYLMRIDGDARVFFPELAEDENLIKVGISNDPIRRLVELNAGFPPGAAIGWAVVRQRRFETSAAAFAAESDCLEALRGAGHWIGGEFGRMDNASLQRLIAERWRS